MSIIVSICQRFFRRHIDTQNTYRFTALKIIKYGTCITCVHYTANTKLSLINFFVSCLFVYIFVWLDSVFKGIKLRPMTKCSLHIYHHNPLIAYTSCQETGLTSEKVVQTTVSLCLPASIRHSTDRDMISEFYTI